MKENLFALALALIIGAGNVNAETQMTVNGRPATKQEKAVAAKMVKQGVQMAKKGAGLAVSAVANPSKAEVISNELEKMGEEMERLGDSLEALTEDTTFLYSEADSLELEGDSILADMDDMDDFIRGMEDGLDVSFPAWMHTWWGKILGGGLGLLGGLLAFVIVAFVFFVLIAIFLAPLWVVALIIWLIVRNNKKTVSQDYMRYQTPHPGQQRPQAAKADGQPAQAAQQTSAEGTGAAQQAATGAETAAGAAKLNEQPEYMTSEYDRDVVQDEKNAMWHSGIMYACVGVGLGILFYSIGLEGLWGIGALVACIGVAKMVIASSHPK